MGAPPPGGGYGPPPGGGYGPPPGGMPPGGMPPGAPPPGYGGLAIVDPYGVEVRNSGMVLLLSIVTCGIYYMWWIYKTSEELNRTLGDPSINPGIDLLLSIISCGLWAIYLMYRNTQKIHHALIAKDPYRKDATQLVLIMNLIPFIGIPTTVVAIYLVQEEFNALARGAQGGDPRVTHGMSF